FRRVLFRSTLTVFTGPIKKKVSSKQSSFGTEMVTVTLLPGDSVPLDGSKVTPDNPVSANQLSSPREPEAGSSVTVQFQLLVLLSQSLFAERLVGLTVKMGGFLHIHGTEIG